MQSGPANMIDLFQIEYQFLKCVSLIGLTIATITLAIIVGVYCYSFWKRR